MHVPLLRPRVLAALMLAGTAGCATTPSARPGATPSDAPVREQVAARYRAGIEAFNAHDLETFLDQFGEDVEMYTHQGWLRGHSAVRARFAGLFQQFPRMRMEVKRLQVREVSPHAAVVDFQASLFPQGGGPAYHAVGSGVYVLREGRWLEVQEHETTTHADPPLPLPPPAHDEGRAATH